MLWGVAALLLLGISFPFHAQQPPEGSVTKVVQGNPTLGIVKFSGELQGRKVLETMLMRCDWFQVLPEGKADRGQVQVQVHVHVGFVVDVPPTEPEDCLQHGLQHRCWTKSGNIRPQKPLQKQAIAHTSKKISGNIGSRSILCPACAFGVRLCRFSPRWAAQARRRSPAAGSAASAAVS